MSRSNKIFFRSALRRLNCAKQDCEEVLSLANSFDLEFRTVWKDVVSRIDEPRQTEGIAAILQEIKKSLPKNADEKISEVVEKDETPKSDYEKTLFRKIVQETHPDKFSQLGIDKEEEKSDRENMFLRAQDAYENGDIEELLDICLILDIDIDGLDIPYDELIKKIENLTKNEYNKMSSITNSIAWKWGHTDTNDKKVRISLIKTMIARFGYYEVSDDTIIQVLKEHGYLEEDNERRDQ